MTNQDNRAPWTKELDERLGEALASGIEATCRRIAMLIAECGNPETASSEAFEQAARICEKTLPPGFRAMSQDWRDGYLVCQREVARAIRERGGK